MFKQSTWDCLYPYDVAVKWALKTYNGYHMHDVQIAQLHDLQMFYLFNRKQDQLLLVCVIASFTKHIYRDVPVQE